MSLLIEVLEWMDPTGSELVYRIPQEGSADIKVGAQLIVRDSQQAIFFKDGKAADRFSVGRHTLTSWNIPLLTKILSFPFGFTSPFRAEVYFFNLKTFIDMKWGTKHPVAFKDSELGLVRLRAHGAYSMRLADPVQFLNTVVGRQSLYTRENIDDFLRDVIIARMNDMLGERLDSIFNLPAKYTELAEDFKGIVRGEFTKYGLELVDFYISSITPPDEVAKMIDERSGMEAVGNLDKYLKYQMAKGLGNSGAGSEAGSAMAMMAGVGMMMPNMMKQLAKTEEEETIDMKSKDSGSKS